MLRRLEYCATQSGLHGLKYVADRRRHWTVRLFWIITVIVSLGLMLLVLQSSYHDFQEKAVSFVTETTYLDWNTTFPAITLCPIAGSEPEWHEDENFHEDEIEMQKLFISDLIYFTGSCYSCVSECKSCQTMNFTEKVEKYRKKCSRIVTTCKWNNVKFDCCEEMLPLETEYGYCYSFNSMHTKRTTSSKLDLTMNRKTGPGELWLQTFEDVRVYFHAPEDVPFINSDPDQRKDVMLGESFNISINVIEIDNDDNVKDVPIHKRGCRFPWENADLTVHEYYSYSTCVVQCHAENHISLCNCTHHLMPSYIFSSEYHVLSISTEHILTEDGQHMAQWNNIKIIGKEDNKQKRKIKESACILLNGDNSIASCSVDIDRTWYSLLKTEHENDKIGYCNVEGLKCLTENFGKWMYSLPLRSDLFVVDSTETVNRLHAKGAGIGKPGLVCDCLPSCVEPEYNVVSETKGTTISHSEIYVKMQSLPTSRFKRIVLRTMLDLVVSVGGTVGLFIGASILSIVEIIYLLCFGESKNK